MAFQPQAPKSSQPSAVSRHSHAPTSSARDESQVSNRASFPVAATLPPGLSLPTSQTSASAGQSSTLDRDSKPPAKGGKPSTAAEAAGVSVEKEKEKKKGILGVFGIKSKKDKESKK